MNPQYLYYVLHAYDLIKEFYGMGAGVRQGLNYDEVKAIKVPFPSVSEQSWIVKYLNDQEEQSFFAIHKNRVRAIYSDTTQLLVFCLYPNY